MTRIIGTLHKELYTFAMVSCWNFHRTKNVSDSSCRENQNTCFPFQNCVLYEIMWKNYGGAWHATDDNIIRRMRFAPWINKDTDTFSIRNVYFSFTAALVTLTRNCATW